MVFQGDSLFVFSGPPGIKEAMEAISFGWKLHVAADPATFAVTGEIVRETVGDLPFLMKAIRDLSRIMGTVQEGKAFTIYVPQDSIRDEVVPFADRLAARLAATLPPPGARIRERPFRESRYVAYRFGEYDANKSAINRLPHPDHGTIFVCRDGHRWFRGRGGEKWLIGPRGELWMDRREGGEPPPWLDDPFNAA